MILLPTDTIVCAEHLYIHVIMGVGVHGVHGPCTWAVCMVIFACNSSCMVLAWLLHVANYCLLLPIDHVPFFRKLVR